MIPTSKIIGIQFSILSPDEIRKSSVAEITSRDTYINNKPVINGLFDPRMGVLEPGLICPTDGLDYIQTPGYFGHIELARPVFYMQYLQTIHKLLHCVCFKCSRLLISKEYYKYLLKMDNISRWKYVFELCKSVKRCGESNEDGCQCLQPKKIRKEGIASLYAEWNSGGGGGGGDSDEKRDENIVILLTPELVLKIFKRISDDDMMFMGFNPKWSRPEWMICQVLAIPPPNVRPSVKHDNQQRSEDDLTHILVNIIKYNKILEEKIKSNASANVINEWTTVLQYYIGSQVDNKIPGSNPVAQRSGRPLKSIKERLNGKGGRMRGNLMAKRVDFSARSVITADPNISIRELGVPLKIAMNITKPVIVNRINKLYCYKLVLNGPDKWPGAKKLERKSGVTIELRHIDRKSIVLEFGDIIHAHMVDGDPILFNRQPTLHRMSMMCHKAKVMFVGDTFRMNVADTKPYNADFDGDEMNLHMPQDLESACELINLAAVPYQLISPGNNSTIIGIFQDSMLGCFRFTREFIRFTHKDAMNLLMCFDKLNDINFKFDVKDKEKLITNFELLSCILPPITLKNKNKLFNYDRDDVESSNNLIEIKNGIYKRGQMDKGILGSTSKGLIQRICNEFGNLCASNFIDDLQNIITEYMKRSAFSVGISDLIVSNKIKEKVVSLLNSKSREVSELITKTHLGVFENNSGKTNMEEFETIVNNILSKAQSDAGREVIKNLDKNNRFLIILNAGSKGSEINIQQMISCLGQQNIDGRRIPYGFEDRTLPHFNKYDDSASARGFVKSSFINGLSPQELFFHAMGGRIGLIDTAVKTSSTGYIQRRLIKGLEDLMINYDMTIRTNKNIIVQFCYGGDNIDSIKIENQDLPLLKMSVQDIYNHFVIIESKDVKKSNILSKIFIKSAYTRHKKQSELLKVKNELYINYMIRMRELIIKKIFNYKSNSNIHVPIAFTYIIDNISGQQNISSNSVVDITLYEAYILIEEKYKQLESIHYACPTELFKVLYYYHLSPKQLLLYKRFNKRTLELLTEKIILDYKRSIVSPGEMVGMIAAQSIGEPLTQMTLNTFHFAGISSKSNVTRGVPRIEEILSNTEKIKAPSLSIYLKSEDQTNKEKASIIQYMIERTKLKDVVKSIDICFDPNDDNTFIEEDRLLILQYKEFNNFIMETLNNQSESYVQEDNTNKSKWILRMEIDKELLLEKNITMDDINFVLHNSYKDEIECIYSDYNSDKLIFRIRIKNIMKSNNTSKNTKKNKINPLDQTDNIYMLKNFQDNLLNNIVLRGINNINKVILRVVKDYLVQEGGSYKQQEIWVLDTVGTNMFDILSLDYIDPYRTFSNDINEIHNVLGMEAARQVIYNELIDVIEFDGTYLNSHHLELLCDRMTYGTKIVSIFRHGINNDNIGPIAKASFEETPEMFLKAARHSEVDNLRGVSSNIMVGQEGTYGTSSFNVLLDYNELMELSNQKNLPDTYEDTEEIDDITLNNLETYIGQLNESHDMCSIKNLSVNNNVSNLKTKQDIDDNDYNPFL